MLKSNQIVPYIGTDPKKVLDIKNFDDKLFSSHICAEYLELPIPLVADPSAGNTDAVVFL